MRATTSKDAQNSKTAKNTRMLSNAFLVLLPLWIALNSRYQGLKTGQEIRRTIQARRKGIVKTHLMVNNCGIIIHKTNHKKGHRHDYDVYRKNHLVTPKQVVSVFDLGYLGVGKDYPEQLSSLPYKKKKNQGLSAEEKERNKSHSRKRMVIEHTICRMKKYRIIIKSLA